MEEFDKEKLKSLQCFWQRVLRLQDWDISAKIVSLREMGSDLSGEVRYNFKKKIADIKILQPEDYPQDSFRPQDMEATLVHELLHLHFAPFETQIDTIQELAEEQIINILSRALVNLNRGE